MNDTFYTSMTCSNSDVRNLIFPTKIIQNTQIDKDKRYQQRSSNSVENDFHTSIKHIIMKLLLLPIAIATIQAVSGFVHPAATFQAPPSIRNNEDTNTMRLQAKKNGKINNHQCNSNERFAFVLVFFHLIYSISSYFLI